MDKLDSFMKAEKERLDQISAPPQYERVVEEALTAAGLGPEGVNDIRASLEAAGKVARLADGRRQPVKKKSGKRRLLWIPAIAACVAIVFALSSFLPASLQEINVPRELPENFKGIITISPLLGAEDRIDPSEGFLITSTEALSKELVEKALVIQPAFDYELTPKKGGTEYEVKPVEPLEKDSIYQIAFDPENSLADLSPRGSYTWAFQTKAEFSLTGTLPRANTSMVPVGASFELIFTSAPDIASVERGVTITPQIPGRWIVEGYKAIYLPDQPLAYKTFYEINIPAGIRDSAGAEATGEGLTVVFHTEGAQGQTTDDLYFDLRGQNLSFRTDEEPNVQFYFNDWDRKEGDPPPRVRATVYAYESQRDYQRDLTEKIKNIDWLYTDEDIWLSADGLSPVAGYDLTGQSEDYTWRLFFPDILPKGYYLADFSLGSRSRQILFQVTDLSVYLVADEKEALLWVNDLQTGLGVSGAEILINDEIKVIADESGVACAVSLPEAKVRLYDVHRGEDQVLMADTNWYYGNQEMTKWMEQRKTAQSYWNYLYVDKPIYRPGDKLNFFGLIAPRAPSAAPVRDVTLRLEYYRSNLNIRQTCAVVDDVLQGSFDLPVLAPGYYNLSMYLDEAFICSTYFEVEIYEKPAYRISLSADKKVAMMGDSIQWTAATNFFDGTPLADQPISFYGSTIDGERVVTSDLSGEIRFNTKAGGDFNYLLNTDYVYATASLPEIGEIYRDSWITVFTSDIELTGRVSRLTPDSGQPDPESPVSASAEEGAPEAQDGLAPREAPPERPDEGEYASADPDAGLPPGDEGPPGGESAGEGLSDGSDGEEAPEDLYTEAYSLFTIDLEAFDVDISRIADPEGNLTEQALSPYDGIVNLEASLIRQHYYRVETGQKYDPYTKQMTPTYDYRLDQIPEASFHWTWADGGQTSFTEELYSPDAYNLVLTFKDRAGRQVIRTFYLPGDQGASGDYPDYGYSWYWVQREDAQRYCSLGEEVTFKLFKNDVPLSAEGSFLFFRTRDKIVDYQVTGDNAYTFAFTESEMPGANIMAVYFNGRRYCPSYYPGGATMDPGERALKAEISTDKERYASGEKVAMDIRLTDAQGRPVKGVINLNLVDEALLAVRDQRVDMGQTLFLGNMYDYNYRVTVSHPSSDGSNMAEGGEGDGGREDFRDTVLFRMLYTDNDGRIRLEFDLPDNITTWRAIWQAWTPDVRAGSGSAAIPVSLPFFTDLRFSEVILEGDEPVLGLRAAGGALPQNTPSQVSWTVGIPELNISQTVTGQAYSWKDFPLPAMNEGSYTLQVRASWEGYSDMVTQYFRVLKSRRTWTAQEAAVLTEGFRPAGSESGLTTVVFSDRKRNQALGGLIRLAGQGSIRVEQRIAALEARKLLKGQFQLDWWGQSDETERLTREQVLRYQNYDGGVAYLPYGESDLYTSAWAASAGGDYFSREDLALYFSGILEDSADPAVDQTLALWGAAACRRPVLPEIRQALKDNAWQGQTLTGQQQLNLVCALIFVGCGNEALAPAEALLRDWTEDLGGLSRAAIGGDRREVLKATAQMAVVAAVLDLPQAEGLYQYILDNPDEGEYFLLEQMICLKAACGRMAEAASFTYTLDGEEISVDLSKQSSYTVTLTPDQKRSVAIGPVNGPVIIESQYQKEGSAVPAGAAGEQMQISRSYRVSDQDSRSLPVYGKIQVAINYRIEKDAPDGCYNIVDYLPAGLRFVGIDLQNTDQSGYQNPWLLEEDGNRLTFGIYKGREAVQGRLLYTVRVAMPGSYLAESASLVHSTLPEMYVRTEDSRIYIN